MHHQQKENRKSISNIIQDRSSASNFADNRIRISKDFTFYGVTQTKAGQAEIAIGLKLILKNGGKLVVQYHNIVSDFDNTEKGIIEFSTQKNLIKIKGENLDDILDYLTEHRLMWIKEPDSDFTKVEEGEVEIEQIEIEET